MHCERTISRRYETIDTQEWKWNFGITSDEPAGTDQGTRIEEVFTIAFEQTKNYMNTQFPADACEHVGGWARQGFSNRPGFTLAFKTVTRQGAFGKNRQAHAVLRGLSQSGLHRVEITWLVAELAVHLDSGNLPIGHVQPHSCDPGIA